MDRHRELDTKALLQRRRAIDALDAELLRLLNQRVRVASEVGRIKKSCGLPIYDGQRERQVLERIRGKNQGPLETASVLSIFRRIIYESRRVEGKKKIVVTGESDGHQHGK
jgi:chorismate mutase-like protein